MLIVYSIEIVSTVIIDFLNKGKLLLAILSFILLDKDLVDIFDIAYVYRR